jgi:hypothetical protein
VSNHPIEPLTSSSGLELVIPRQLVFTYELHSEQKVQSNTFFHMRSLGQVHLLAADAWQIHGLAYSQARGRVPFPGPDCCLAASWHHRKHTPRNPAMFWEGSTVRNQYCSWVSTSRAGCTLMLKSSFQQRVFGIIH